MSNVSQKIKYTLNYITIMTSDIKMDKGIKFENKLNAKNDSVFHFKEKRLSE